MDYNYIRLEKQVKQLMNRNYVPSSSHAQTAEEIIKSPLRLYIDLTSKWFMFSYIGSSFDPLYIDPVNRAIMNVKFLNDVDISKLVGGLAEGYGITIDSMGGGVYKINVKQEMFALKADLDAINDRFDDYTTTEDLAATYATKAKVEEVERRFDDYTTTEDLAATYATKAKVEEVERRFDDYTTTADLEATYAKKGDIVPTESEFITINGYPDYYVKNEHVSTYIDDSLSMASFNVLVITLPPEVNEQIFSAPDNVNIFKFSLRKEIIYNGDGKLLTEFYAYLSNRKPCSPVVLLYGGTQCITQHWTTLNGNFCIAFDTRLNIKPLSLYQNGELSIQYMLHQDTLESKLPTLKCDIIDAKNALKLYESDIRYLYKPNVINEQTVDGINYYKMVFNIPGEYTFPESQEFKFVEHCFGNVWSLKWNGARWEGKNCQGCSNAKIINKCNTKCEVVQVDYSAYDINKVYGAYIMVQKDWNEHFIPKTDDNLMKSLWDACNKTFSFLMKDDTIKDVSEYKFKVVISDKIKAKTFPNSSYDMLPIKVIADIYGDKISTSDVNNFNTVAQNVQRVYIDLTLPGQSIGMRLTLIPKGEVKVDSGYGVMSVYGEKDTIEKIAYAWSGEIISETIDTSGVKTPTRNIELYLRKDMVDPIEEINWDGTTNPFKYIIKMQYYEVYPNPNAASTLYTDYNITSSKIITADNITTMRSDLNVLTNNFDVVSFDVKDLTNKVETLNSEMANQKDLTRYLEKEVGEVKVMAGIALGISAFNGIGGMKLLSSGIKFGPTATGEISSGTLSGVSSDMGYWSEASSGVIDEFSDVSSDVPGALSLRAARIDSNWSKLLDWIDKRAEPISFTFDSELKNPENVVLSAKGFFDISNQYRDSLKPKFKVITDKIEEIATDIENIDLSGPITALETKLNEYINHNELVRDDAIDIIPKVDQENHILTFELEGDTLYDGLFVFKIYAGAMISQRLRRLYIKVVDGQIAEYKGVQDSQITINGITIKPAANSENDRIEYIPTAELDVESRRKIIRIPITDPSYKIAGAIVEQSTFKRQMVYTTSDIAYLQDIDALNKKIDALAEQSHTNDIQTFSMQDEFATIQEVNDVLTNYVQTKDLPPTVDLADYYTKTETNNTFALNTSIDELQQKITALEQENNALKATLANLTLKQFPFLNYYTGFEEVKFYNETTDISNYVFYRYVSTSRTLNIIYDLPDNNIAEYLCVLISSTGTTTITQFFRINRVTTEVYIDEIKSPNTTPVIGTSSSAVIYNINLPITNTDGGKQFPFSFVFQKV